MGFRGSVWGDTSTAWLTRRTQRSQRKAHGNFTQRRQDAEKAKDVGRQSFADMLARPGSDGGKGLPPYDVSGFWFLVSGFRLLIFSASLRSPRETPAFAVPASKLCIVLAVLSCLPDAALIH